MAAGHNIGRQPHHAPSFGGSTFTKGQSVMGNDEFRSAAYKGRMGNGPMMSAGNSNLGMRMGSASRATMDTSISMKGSSSNFMTGGKASIPNANSILSGLKNKRTGTVMMAAGSSDFSISGAGQPNMIKDYQDMSPSSIRASKPPVGGFRRNNKQGPRSRVVMNAVPEGSWGDVKRQPVVGGNWKSNGDRDFVNSFPDNVLNTSTFDAEKMTVCVAPTDIHLSMAADKV